MQVRSWLFSPTQNPQMALGLAVPLPCLSPQSMFALLYLNLCPRSVCGGGAALTSQAPLPSGFWLGLDKERYQQIRNLEEREGGCFFPSSHPAGSWSGCIHPGPQSMSDSSFLSPWLHQSRIFVIFFFADVI